MDNLIHLADDIIPLSAFDIFVLCMIGLAGLAVVAGFTLAVFAGIVRPILAMIKRRQHWRRTSRKRRAVLASPLGAGSTMAGAGNLGDESQRLPSAR